MNEIPEALRAELDALLAQPEAGINCADVSETKAADWVDAERGKFLRATTKIRSGKANTSRLIERDSQFTIR